MRKYIEYNVVKTDETEEQLRGRNLFDVTNGIPFRIAALLIGQQKLAHKLWKPGEYIIPIHEYSCDMKTTFFDSPGWWKRNADGSVEKWSVPVIYSISHFVDNDWIIVD